MSYKTEKKPSDYKPHYLSSVVGPAPVELNQYIYESFDRTRKRGNIDFCDE